MAATLEVESTLTDRYQTTVPETVRRALKLGKRDKLHYSVRPGGEVVLSRVDVKEKDDPNDPLLGRFLDFLASDIANHPEQIRAIDTDLAKRIKSLVSYIEVDLDNALSAEDE
jgi:antitoxin PrlF